eukprot:Nitzschia sp. Nitz4//scaffold114_size70088//17202//19510//NITZ4_005972-RA/size70088-snap-gene-0.11-mRNA-1//-1//CDS//3329533408//2915//frame0
MLACRRSNYPLALWVSLQLSLILVVLQSLPCLVQSSWVDPDTPEYFRSTRARYSPDQREYELVFSDEFEQPGRTFHDGNDPRWTAINKNDYTNAALHFYSNENAITRHGKLNITTEQKVNEYRAFNETTKKYYPAKKHVQTAMLQGWNKFCFTGGIVEFSAKLPGEAGVGGLWPALWMLGNLARATYVGSSDFMWPYSYNQCDPRSRNSQEINACSKVNHYGMKPYMGRGAPEIDVIEAMQGDKEKLPSTNITRPYQSCSFQVAPGIERGRPILGLPPKEGHWYTGMEYNTNNETRTELNPFFYGVKLEHKMKSYTYQADALSANFGLNSSYYTSQQTYRVEWDPPEEDGSGGYIRWYTNDIFLYGVSGANLNITGSEIPREAMYLIMNTAVASSWGFAIPCPADCTCECFECGNPDCECALPEGYCKNFPASFEIDYVRVYQAKNEKKHILGCSPVDRPTELFIEGHQKRYMDSGDRSPLQPVVTGGAPCQRNSQCGGIGKGSCSERGFCVCGMNFTGPTCLAHAGFYENESRSKTSRSIGCLLIVMVGAMREKKKHHLTVNSSTSNNYSYSSMAAANMREPQKAPVSYQHSAEYALPPKQNVVTYCVIDGKLVD